MYIYVYVYIYIFVCVCVCVYTYIHTYIYVHIYIWPRRPSVPAKQTKNLLSPLLTLSLLTPPSHGGLRTPRVNPSSYQTNPN